MVIDMKPKMPRSLRLAGRRVRIVTESPIDFDLGPGRQAQGLHSGWDNTITLDLMMAPDQLRAIAVHEIVHDLDKLAGTEMTERDVTAFASVLFAALRDNPNLVRWLMDKA